jgi:hypothetical protein
VNARALIICAALLCYTVPATAQTKPAPPPPPATPQKPAPPAKPAPPGKPAPPAKPAPPKGRTENPNRIGLRGFVTFGGVMFQARESFEAILGTNTGPTYGGGAQVLLPWNLYAEVAVWRFSAEGERVFVGPNDEVFRLGIPVEVSIMPIEITGGWRYRHCPQPSRTPPRTPLRGTAQRPPVPPRPAGPCNPRFIPYAGGGFSSYTYDESSKFAAAGENVSQRFNGFHLVGGAEYRIMRWLAIGGEVGWSSIPDALGAGGVSDAFNEDNLGGTTFRLKLAVGR